MKVFRDIFAAITIGILGGLLVSTVSYYHSHKEGGIKQTLFAVLNSFDTVATAYSQGDDSSLLAGLDYNFSDQVLETFERIENGEEISSGEIITSILSGSAGENRMEDVLAMESEDGKVREGAPYSGIIRFHVRANSDRTEDQELKMAVKEDVMTLLTPLLSTCSNVEESRKIIVANLQNIYTVAVNTIIEQGYDYDVKVYLTEEEFPAKTYGDLTFPAGEYQALRIDIGAAKGQNWWCVMYPPLCFIDGSTVVVSKEGKEELREALTPEEYEELFAERKGDGEAVTIKGESWIFNWLREHN